ncbi:MAG: flagellar basal body rod protein FlgB [Alphaproteobacteria bacterium]
MAISDLPVLNMLKTRMKWHQARQQVLAQNVANSDTPGFVPSDIKSPNIQGSQNSRTFAGLAVTNVGHISGTAASAGAGGRVGHAETSGWETTPAGNSVVLEEQMMKVTQNQMDYQAAAALYARSLSLIKSAMGSG